MLLMNFKFDVVLECLDLLLPVILNFDEGRPCPFLRIISSPILLSHDRYRFFDDTNVDVEIHVLIMIIRMMMLIHHH